MYARERESRDEISKKEENERKFLIAAIYVRDAQFTF
jgi:hypothetical protein